MKNKKFESLLKLLTNKSLLHSSMPSVDEIIKKLKKRKTIKIIYGETYDIYGQSLDSLKYYFFIHILHELFEQLDFKVSSQVIIGDVHSVKNKIVKDKDQLLSIADNRLKGLQKIKKIYGLKFEPLLMSHLLKSNKFQENLKTVSNLFSKSEQYQEIAKKTVLQNRISQEEKTGFQYVVEEVALIINYDIKIGPPRENNYDKLALLIGKQLSGIYLNPTYPLGMNFDFFITHPEIEEYGLTPYKAGGNQLQENRIILGVTKLDKIKQLINDSFISVNPLLPNPVYDVYLTTQMAKSLLNNEKLRIDDSVMNNPVELKQKAYEALLNSIIKPLNT